jgi:hypothetical protein
VKQAPLPGPAGPRGTMATEEFELDQRYEFDAPKHYNFTRLSQGDSHASDWFATRDCAVDGACRRGRWRVAPR